MWYRGRMRCHPLGPIILATLLGLAPGCKTVSPPKGLLGRFRGPTLGRPGESCRRWLVFLADGTLETNVGMRRCGAARLLTYRVDSHALTLQQRGLRDILCRYELKGRSLLLACGRKEIPESLRYAKRFEHAPEQPLEETLRNLVGEWHTRFGRGTTGFTIEPNGTLLVKPRFRARLVLVVGHRPTRFELRRRGQKSDHCIYRVTRERLTLCCDAHSKGKEFPTSFASCNNPLILIRRDSSLDRK